MTVLLRLTEARLRRVGERLLDGSQFTVTVPERLIAPSRRWRVVLLTADTDRLNWDGANLDVQSGGMPSIAAVARLRGSGRSSTTDDRVRVADAHLLSPPLPIRELVNTLPRPSRSSLRQAMQGIAAELDSPLADDVLSALVRARPDLAEVVESLSRFGASISQGDAAPIVAMERDAAHLALAIAGFEFDDSGLWDVSEMGSYLARLRYAPREEILSGYDALRFPAWQPLPSGRIDWTTFSDGRHQMRIGNVNSTPLERVLGVDLIYRHLGADSFVLVQYKKMSVNSAGSWGYRPDAQLSEELERMRKADDSQPQSAVEPTNWRLYPKGCFVKLVRPPEYLDPANSRLLSGIYLPVPYLDELLTHGTTLGPRGGKWLGYDTIDRYLTTTLFVALVREGWIGTRGVTTRAIEALVNAAVGQGNSIMIAEEVGTLAGSERRGRRQPI